MAIRVASYQQEDIKMLSVKTCKGVIIIGDYHYKKFPSSPYNKGLDKLIAYMLEKYAGYVWIFTGDFFDDDVMHYGVIAHAVKLLKMHDTQVYIVTGNHELGNLGNVLTPLIFSGINVIYEFSKFNVGDYKVHGFPFLSKVKDMKSFEDVKDECDVSIAHFALPGQTFGSSDEISLQHKAHVVHVNGHIHLPSKTENEYGEFITVGVPQPSRNLEQFHQPQVVRIENGKYFLDDLPRFFTIEDIKFGEKPKFENSIVNITDAPSLDVVRMEYKDFNVREEGIKLKRTEIDIKTSVEEVLHKDINQKWMQWSTDNKKSKEIQEIVSTYLVS